MTDDSRTVPPYRADEMSTLLGFLRHQRETLLMKCASLTDDQLQIRSTVSKLTLLGLVKHLAYVERYWFQGVFEDRIIDVPWSEDDPNADFRIEQGDTAEAIFALYERECAESDAILAANDLNQLAAWTPSEEERRSLRWIANHMIRETARHCGHADIIREAIDGAIGE